MPAFGFGIRLGGAGTTPTPPTPPSTVSYDFSQVGQGWTLTTDSTTAGRLILYSDNAGANSGAYWCGMIDGTSAGATISGVDAYNDAIECSIDDGAWFTATKVSGGTYTLFSGLTQAKRKVVLRINGAYANYCYVSKTGALMSVTGVSPSIVPFANWVQPGEGNANTVSASGLRANYPNASPAYITDGDYSNGSVKPGSNPASLAIRGNFTTLAVAHQAPYVYVSVDGGAVTRYNIPNGGCLALNGLSGTHTYYVTGFHGAFGPLMAVGGILATGETGIQNIASKKRLDQYGDSITYGARSTGPGDVDVNLVAASFGRIAGNAGISGDTVEGLDARMTSGLSERTVTSADVAIVAIGRNSLSGSSFPISNYQSIVNKLLTKGYGKVICRGILPNTGGSGTTDTHPTENGLISNMVTSMADSRVKFCDTSSWTNYQCYAADGDFYTHPTDAGYQSIAAYAQPAYAALGV